MALTKTDEGVREVLRRVHATAARQDWAVTLSQLGPAGADRNTVRRMVRSGRWVPLTRGSYWVGQDEGARPCAPGCGGPPDLRAPRGGRGPHGRPTAGHAGSPQGRRHPAPGRSHGPRDPQPPRHPRAATLPHALGLA
ncbi:type IV toxin-antitoxin system AbiEi family antitoxin domain-containing protein [Streptomyces sp. ME12-02E]|uniref:type IV toxin-antitoxin system AbiEi family antitoxin domain-containing protein n=1 Tax=unclassified Streptomyces TaxID=2593676 RepID=UPI0039F5F352